MNLPETPPAAVTLLRSLQSRLPPDQIDRVWIFPTYRLGDAESTVAIVSAFHEDRDRRRVLTATLTCRRAAQGDPDQSEDVHENAITPVDRVAAIVTGVTHRLADEVAAAPTESQIHGDPARWDQLLAELVHLPARPAARPTAVARRGGIRYQ